MYVLLCVIACGDQRLTKGIFFNRLSTHHLKKQTKLKTKENPESLTESELTFLLELLASEPPAPAYLHPPELENQLFNVDSENLNLGPRVLPTKQSLGPRVLFPISKTQTTATVSQAN